MPTFASMATVAWQIASSPKYSFSPFPEAMQKTMASKGALMAPLARTAQRESQFTWVAKIIDVPQAMGTLRSRPAADLASGKALARVGVVKSGVQEGFLRDSGYSNLVAYGTARELADALAAGQIDAWYGTATEIAAQFEAIGKGGDVQVGPTLQVAPVWLAASPDPGALPLKPIQEAISRLEARDRINAIYRSYVRA